ncbi:MAG: type II secretion system protein [Oligosphaeraceae bacterium]|nr:type II secretion system protein [Oligosphaeraceae bacterium]
MKSAQKQLSAFTMVELLLAMGVCVIGICGIMVLFPVGATASRDAAMETYAANAADQMLGCLKYAITQNATEWDKYIIAEGATATGTSLPDDNPSNKENPTTPYNLQDTAVWSTSLGVVADNIFKHNTNNGVFQIISCRDDSPAVNSPNVDFRAIMNVWRKDVTVGAVTLPHRMAIQLNVEVSWPAALPYNARQKSTFILEVFNPNYSP